MVTRIDMHSHTKGSDGRGTPAQIALAAKKAGLDALCLTDHHTNLTPEVEEVATALRNVGVLPILGVEYSTAQGHLLIFGVDVPSRAWGMYPPMQRVIDDVNALGGACVVPHPYKGYQRALREEVETVRGLAAVEVVNGQCEDERPETNRRALRSAEKMGIARCAGSDAHNPLDIGNAFTVFDDEIKTEGDFLAALKAGRFHPEVDPVRQKAREARAARAAAWAADPVWTAPAPRYAWAKRVTVGRREPPRSDFQRELDFRRDAGHTLDEIIDAYRVENDDPDMGAYTDEYLASMAWDD